jgi:pheromone shutdown protein TraB
MDAHYEDPRISGEHLRSVDTPTGTVTLVGVVHDHPASAFRVRTAVADRAPDVLALELPPLSLPLFERYAEDTRTPPAFGGEASAAIQAATTDRVVGIDGPTLPFLRRLAASLYREGGSVGTVRGILDGFATVTKNALRCRFAASLASLTSVRLEVDSPVTYAVDRADSPERQAENERRQIDRARAVMDTFEPSRATSFGDDVRETHMIDRLADLRGEGDIVAVVGRHHLDPVAEGLADRVSGDAESARCGDADSTR